MEMMHLDSENNLRWTDVGAEFDTPELTKEAFESLRQVEVDITDAHYICDLYNDDDEIVESIAINRNTYRTVTGEPLLSEQDYIRIDEKRIKVLML